MTTFFSLASVYAQLANFANLSNFWSLFDTAFGSSYDFATAASFRSQWQSGNFSLFPQIEVVSSDVLGSANGAYAISTNRIYLSDQFVSVASQQSLDAVILEEFGHFVDAQVNQTDTTGDEGELFSALVRGVSLSGSELARIKAEDDHAVISLGGQLITVEQAALSSTINLAQTFFLNSLPGANHTIYLDFDGYSEQGSIYPSGFLNIAAFDFDNNTASFSNAELERIQAIWQRVAEDFIPFNVNVTTQAPTDINDLIKNGTADTRWGIRVVIGGSRSDFGISNAVGVAVGSFGATENAAAFVFENDLDNGDEKRTAETISHEVGHTLGLHHDNCDLDGNGVIQDSFFLQENYYSGHGDGETGWAPIMGHGDYKNLSQWSKGEYTGAFNKEDDLQIITTQNGFGYRPDDTGNTIATAKALTLSGNSISGSGIIEQNTDVDFYRFSTGGISALNLVINPATRGPNLDILAELYNSSGVLIASSNPTDFLSANFLTTVTAGTYYLKIDGVGKGDPLTTGYSDYGSLGQYFIDGTVNNNVTPTIFGTTGYKQIGTNQSDYSSGVITDNSGYIYTDITTSGAFPGSTNSGGFDVYLIKYDSKGSQVWIKQFCLTSESISNAGITIDNGGNIYISGYTSGILPGNNSLGAQDAYIAKYDTNSNQIWVKQFGTSDYDNVGGIIADSSGSIYVAGFTYGTLPGNNNFGSGDVYLAKYSANGSQIWIKQFGSSAYDSASGITTDNTGNIYITGSTSDTLSGNSSFGYDDAYLAKYDANGNQLWIKQFGSSSADHAYGISTDGSGNIYIAGNTQGDLFGNTYLGNSDAYIAKYDTNGNLVWLKTFGSFGYDSADKISVDSSGGIYVSGSTSGALFGNSNLGNYDAYLAKYDVNGNQLWFKQLGSSGNDFAGQISVNSTGNVYVTGSTDGALPGNTSSGQNDTFIAGFDTNGNLLVPIILLTVSPSSVTEDGTPNLVYTFTRTGPTTNTLTVNYSIAGTATATDYTGATPGTGKTITFAAGSATATLTIDPTADTTIEANETVALTLATGTGYTIGTTTAVTGTITNDDLPSITLAVAPASVLEDGTTNLVYTFTRTGATTNALTVNYGITGTADATDYTGATPGTGKTITFAAGSATATLTIDPTADTTIEANETVALTLATGTGYTIGTAAVTGTIQNDDLPSITLAVSPASVLEDGTQNLVYTFTRTGPITNALTINYGITGTADATDYIGETPGTGKTITFAAGSATATLTIDPTADTTIEANETVALTLATGTGYTIGTTTAVTGTITNDDLPSITLAVSPASVLENGTTNLVYTFTRTGATTNALTVNYSIAGTATATDYTGATPGTGKTITFATGSATATLTIDPTADTTIEANETVALNLATGTGYTIGTATAVTGTITNDDVATLPSITLAVAPVSVLEDGTPNLIYTFTRTGATTNALTVNYGITGTATNGTDYATIGTSVTFAAGSSTATVTVNPTPDTVIEANETVALTLATGTGYTIGTSTAVTGTIINDDPTITLGLNLSGISENSPSNFVYTFTRTGVTTNALTVNYSIAGTAISTDYIGATPGIGKTITFAVGSATATLTLDPTADTILETDETISLQLTTGTGYSIGTTNPQIATIINDDGTRRQKGTSGQDVILGTNLRDILSGGLGNDILTGGLGGDSFSFNALNEGIDSITDFSVGNDDLFVGCDL